MEHAPPPAIAQPADLGERLNRLSARLAGREMATRFGRAGDPRLPALDPASLGLDAAARARLAASVVYVLPGGPWPGVRRSGAVWLAPWAAALRDLGVGRVVGLPLLDGRDLVTAALEPMVSRLTRHHEACAAARIAADVAARPPGPGGRTWLLGHSYGSLLAGEVAERLPGRLDGAILMETYLAPTNLRVDVAPRLPFVLVAENDPGTAPRAEPGTRLETLYMPEVAHMDMVLRPPARLLRAIVRAIAGVAP